MKTRVDMGERRGFTLPLAACSPSVNCCLTLCVPQWVMQYRGWGERLQFLSAILPATHHDPFTQADKKKIKNKDTNAIVKLHFPTISCRVSSLCDGGGVQNRSCRGTDGGVCDEPRRSFLRRAAAHFPLRAWFNSPYAYRVGVISLFITSSFFFFYCRLSMSCRFMPVARVHLPDRGSNATTTDGKWLLRVTAYIYLYFRTKRTDAACVLKGDRMGCFEPPSSFWISPPWYGTCSLFLLKSTCVVERGHQEVRDDGMHCQTSRMK